MVVEWPDYSLHSRTIIIDIIGKMNHVPVQESVEESVKTLQFNKSEIQFKLHSNLQKPQLKLPKILVKAQQELQRVQ